MTTITAQQYTLRPEGIYEGEFTAWEETESGQWGPGVKLIFLLGTRDDGTPDEKWLFASQKLTPKSSLWKILKSMGAQVVLGQTYDLDTLIDPLIGFKGQLVIKHVDRPNGEQDRITDILPLAGANTAAADKLKTDKICTVPKCKATETSVYDEDGNPFCAVHAG